MKAFILPSFILLLLSSCLYKKYENVSPVAPAKTDTVTTTTTITTTTGTTPPVDVKETFTSIEPLFLKTCMPCHDALNNDGQVDLTSYTSTVAAAKRGVILNNIIPGAAAMPLSGTPFTVKEYNRIKAWIDKGMLK